MDKYIIVDWAYNLPFGYETFDSFEDAWSRIYEVVEDEDNYQEYEVILKSELLN